MKKEKDLRRVVLMGYGYRFSCNRCWHKYYAMLGYGMKYAQLYRETVEEIKDGVYGAEWQKMMIYDDSIAVNCEREIYVCDSCGHWKEALNLSLYKVYEWQVAMLGYRQGIKEVNENGFLPEHGKNELVKRFVHSCCKCGSKMRRAENEEIERLFCPACGSGDVERQFMTWE